MNVDVVAMLQGIHNARDAKKIPQEMHTAIVRAMVAVAETGSVGRTEIDYGVMLQELAGINGFPAFYWSDLWELYLGKAIAEGIGVASHGVVGD
jgi:hypothetical protein